MVVLPIRGREGLFLPQNPGTIQEIAVARSGGARPLPYHDQLTLKAWCPTSRRYFTDRRVGADKFPTGFGLDREVFGVAGPSLPVIREEILVPRIACFSNCRNRIFVCHISRQ